MMVDHQDDPVVTVEDQPVAAQFDDMKKKHNMKLLVVAAPLLVVAALIVVVTSTTGSDKASTTEFAANVGNRLLRSTEEDHGRSFLMRREVPEVKPSSTLKKQNGQVRPSEWLGKSRNGYVHTLKQTQNERRQEMEYIQQVRRDPNQCGRPTGGTNWKRRLGAKYMYYHMNNAYELDRGIDTVESVRRYTCDAKHPKYYDTDKLQIHIERYGPFRSTGNGDWSRFMNYPFTGDYDLHDKTPATPKLLMYEELMENKEVFVRGSFVSIVKESGDFLSYPPLHMHHLHLHPYANGRETMDNILPKRVNGTKPTYDIGIVGGGSAFMDHHIIAQQHGDSLCNVDGVDDFSCLLHLLPPGHGMRVSGSTGFRLDFDVNDVRTSNTKKSSKTRNGIPIPDKLEPLEYYVEVAVLWTPKPQIPSTYLHIAAPEYGEGPSTYSVPIDDSSSMIYFNYTHDWRDDDDLPVGQYGDERLAAGVRGVQGLGAGTISNIVGHVHHSMFDSLFIFKDSKKYSNRLFEAIDTIRPKDHYLPYIPECHHETLEDLKDRMSKLALGEGGGELVCEVTKPGLVWAQTPTGSTVGEEEERTLKAPSFGYRDRLMDLNCKKDIRLEPGDTLTFVSFTKSRATSTLGPIQRGTFQHLTAGVYEGSKKFAQSEHTIMRMDFVSDKAVECVKQEKPLPFKNQGRKGDLYTPPSMYLTQRWPIAAPDEGCWQFMRGPQWKSFINKNIKGFDESIKKVLTIFDDDPCESHWKIRMASMMDQCPAAISMDGEVNKKTTSSKTETTKTETSTTGEEKKGKHHHHHHKKKHHHHHDKKTKKTTGNKEEGEEDFSRR